MLSPSKLYASETGYFFFTSDQRFFSIYFSVYTLEFVEKGVLRSDERIMIGLAPIPQIPEPYTLDELQFSNVKPSEEIDIALTTAIRKFFDNNPEEILIYLLSNQKGKQAARKKRFKSIVEKLGNEITCFNYEFDTGFPDTGFLVLTNNPDSDAVQSMFDEFVKQFS